jgi:hypothetical protein
MDTRKHAQQDLSNAVYELSKNYSSLLHLMQNTPFYKYQTTKYSAHIHDAALNSADPGIASLTLSQTFNIAKHEAEYARYDKQLKELLNWWSHYASTYSKTKEKLGEVWAKLLNTQQNIDHPIACFKAMSKETLIWRQIEQYLYKQPLQEQPPESSSDLSKQEEEYSEEEVHIFKNELIIQASIVDKPDDYFLLAQLNNAHCHIKELLLDNTVESDGTEFENIESEVFNFENFLNQHIDQKLTQAIDQYVKKYHQVHSSPLNSRGDISQIMEDIKPWEQSLFEIARILYYWPSFNGLYEASTQKHITAKHILFSVGNHLQRDESTIAKKVSLSVHQWMVTQFAQELDSYMRDYALHSGIESEDQHIISIGFFQSPSLPEVESPTPGEVHYLLPSPSSSLSTYIDD